MNNLKLFTISLSEDGTTLIEFEKSLLKTFKLSPEQAAEMCDFKVIVKEVGQLAINLIEKGKGITHE